MLISKVNGTMQFTCESFSDEYVLMQALKMYADAKVGQAFETGENKGHANFAASIDALTTDIFLMDAENVPAQAPERITAVC